MNPGGGSAIPQISTSRLPVAVRAKRKDKVLVLITSEFAALALALVVADLGDLSVAGLFLTLWGGSVAGLVAARAWWRSLTDSWRGGIHYLLDQLTRTTKDVIASKHVPAEVTPPSRPVASIAAADRALDS